MTVEYASLPQTLPLSQKPAALHAVGQRSPHSSPCIAARAEPTRRRRNSHGHMDKAASR